MSQSPRSVLENGISREFVGSMAALALQHTLPPVKRHDHETRARTGLYHSRFPIVQLFFDMGVTGVL